MVSPDKQIEKSNAEKTNILTAPYFAASISAADLDEINIETMETIEIIRNTLYKAYLEDFYQFSLSLGGSTAVTMAEILQVGARENTTLTINSFYIV